MEIQTVLCPIDFTDLSDSAMRVAVEICGHFGARLILHHNLDVRPPNYLSVAWMWSETHEKEEEQKATEVPARLEKLFETVPPGIEYEARITRGPLDTSLLYLSRELSADLVVMASRGWSSSEHKSLTELAIVKSGRPVLTLEESCSGFRLLEGEKAARVVVPVDFSERARVALDYALALGRELSLELHLLHVVKAPREAQTPEAMEVQLEAARERMGELTAVTGASNARAHVMVGEPSERIQELIRELEARFVVMASHGKNILQRWLSGTTTLETLHGSCCPVWFVPPTWRVGRAGSARGEMGDKEQAQVSGRG